VCNKNVALFVSHLIASHPIPSHPKSNRLGLLIIVNRYRHHSSWAISSATSVVKHNYNIMASFFYSIIDVATLFVRSLIDPDLLDKLETPATTTNNTRSTGVHGLHGSSASLSSSTSGGGPRGGTAGGNTRFGSISSSCQWNLTFRCCLCFHLFCLQDIIWLTMCSRSSIISFFAFISTVQANGSPMPNVCGRSCS